jgi:hypothetical protein
MVHLDKTVRCRGMAFGKTSRTDREAAPVAMRAAGIEALDMSDEVGGVTADVETVVVVVVRTVTWRVAAKCEDVVDADPSVVVKNAVDVLLAMVDAGEVGERDRAWCSP